MSGEAQVNIRAVIGERQHKQREVVVGAGHDLELACSKDRMGGRENAFMNRSCRSGRLRCAGVGTDNATGRVAPNLLHNGGPDQPVA